MNTIYFNNTYTACKYAFDTTRKSAEIADSLTENPIDGVVLADPAQFFDTAELIIKRLHDADYVRAVKTGVPKALAQSQGFLWDEGIYPMAVSHSGGLVAAADTVMAQKEGWAASFSSGLHHAKSDSGDGFCTFNGLAVAAQRAFDLGARNILVIDFDDHCGGGTYSMTRHLPVTQIDVSTSPFDVWRPTFRDKLSSLDMATTSDYSLKIANALQTVGDAHNSVKKWDFVIYNAGMDPANSGVSFATIDKRERAVAQCLAALNVPTIVAIAGGYTWGSMTMERLVDLHRLTFSNFAKFYN